LAVLPALAFAAFVTLPPAHALLTHDSPGYMYFAAGRPVAYPAFLWLMHHATAGYGAVPAVQAALFCAAVAWLGLAARDFAGGLGAALALQAAVLVYPAPLRLADEIMADSLSATLTVAFVAQALRIAAAPSSGLILGAALLAGLGVAVRPDNIALIPAALLLAFCGADRVRRLRAVGAAAICLPLAVAMTPLAQWAVHGSAHGDGRLGRELMQKALFLPPPANGGDPRCDAAYIDRAAAPLVAYWQAAPARLQDVLRLRISNLLRYRIILPGLLARRGVSSAPALGPGLFCYTLLRARDAPLAMVAAAGHEYANLLLNYSFVSAAWRVEYLAWLRAHPPPLPAWLPPPDLDAGLWQRAVSETGGAPQAAAVSDFAAPAARNRFIVFGLDAVQLAGCLAAWAFIALAPFVPRRHVLVGAALGMALQLHLTAAAIMEIAEPRYVFPLWPLFLGVLFVLGGSLRQEALLFEKRSKLFS
jgi:hypothetical protein